MRNDRKCGEEVKDEQKREEGIKVNIDREERSKDKVRATKVDKGNEERVRNERKSRERERR